MRVITACFLLLATVVVGFAATAAQSATAAMPTNVERQGSQAYDRVDDSFGVDVGAYGLSAAGLRQCDLTCPPGGFPEGEPPLENDQENNFNDGCSSSNPDGFQDLAGDPTGSLVLCGKSGWFTQFGLDFRDSDWFVLHFGPAGVIELTADAEYPLYVFELGPQDCAYVAPVQLLTVGPCAPGSLTLTGAPESTAWLWTGATTFLPPGGAPTPFEFDYIISISGLSPGPVAVQSASWSRVKGLYR